MFSNDQDGILGSFIRSMLRKFVNTSGYMPLDACNSSKVGPCSETKEDDDPNADKVPNSNSKPKNNSNKNDDSKDPKFQYIWEIERGHGHHIQSFYYGWVLERLGSKSNYQLRNSTTHRVLELPDTMVKNWSHRMLPCYLSSRKTFKMSLAYPSERNGELRFKVLTVGVEDTWRRVHFRTTYNLTNRNWILNVIGQVLVVVLYPETDNNNVKSAAAMVFLEVETEQVRSIDVATDFITNERNSISLVSWNGKPAVARKLENDLLYVWVVEDYKNQKWAKEKIILSLTRIHPDARRYYDPYHFSDNKIWMHRNRKSYLTFDVVSKVVTYIDGPKTPGVKFMGQPSLLDLEGTKLL